MSPALTIVLAVIGSGALGTIAAKYFRPNATPIEILNEVQEERVEDRKRIARLEHNTRILTDYVHLLRQHIADGKKPPPPEWPEGMQS